MKKFISNVQNKLATVKAKANLMAVSVSTAMYAASPMSVRAASDPGAVVKAACDVVVDMFPFIGAFFIVAGVFKLILAYRNDQPESQAGAAKDIVIGAVFVVFKTFVWNNLSEFIL